MTTTYVIIVIVHDVKLDAPQAVQRAFMPYGGYLKDFEYGAPSSQPVRTPELTRMRDALDYDHKAVAEAVVTLLQDYYANNTHYLANVSVWPKRETP